MTDRFSIRTTAVLATSLVLGVGMASMATMATTGCSSKKPGDSQGKPGSKTAIPATAGEMPPPAVPFAGPSEPTRLTKLLRFPDIHDDLVVFTYAGDLWLARTSGGTASRLTAHPGLELFGKFSPDGKWIAFTGQYGGDEQVYIVPTGGGEPRQLTFYPALGPLPARWGYDNQVYGWSPDGTQVLFRSMRDSFDVATPHLYLAPVAGGLPTTVPLPRAGAGDLDPTGKKLLYSPLFRDFRTWKRYEGGWAQDLYLFDTENRSVSRITEHVRANRDPMWVGDAIYFGSDRDGTHNIYRHDSATGEAQQVTSYRDWDVRWPSSDGKGQIVFELDGELHRLAVGPEGKTGEATKIPIYVPDDGTRTRPERVSVAGNLENFDLGPTGKRALVVARGDVFSVPVEHGLVRNLTHSSNAHEREAAWSADGKWVAYISDWTGEEQVWIAGSDGSNPARALTTGHEGRLYGPVWSPDGNRIAYSDQTGKLYVVATTGNPAATGVEVADDPINRIAPEYTWSPDSQYLAYSLRASSGYASIHIWGVRDSRSQQVTGELFDEGAPTWHPDGKHLYFLANREFHAQLDVREWNFVQNRATGIFALALTKDSPNPFAPRDDEAGKKDDEGKGPGGASGPGASGGQKPGAAKPVKVTIDFDGIAQRVIRVPVEAENFTALVATKEHLLYSRRAAFYFGRQPDHQPMLEVFSLKERKAAPLVKNVAGWAVSRDGKKVLVAGAPVPGQPGGPGGLMVHDVRFSGAGGPPAPPPGAPGAAKPVALDGLVVHRVAKEEWEVVYNQVWRRFRDYFYVANMHGYDWAALGEKYRGWLEHVGHRSDLNYVIGELIAELNVSHAYISGGDERLPARAPVALLGARFELDAASGRYRVASIFEGQNAEAIYRSPLTEVGVGIAVGDHILAINGRSLQANQNPYARLQLPAGKPVALTVSSDSAGRNSRVVLVDPIASEANLVYLRWVLDNQRKVTAATGGRVGYLHIPDMGPAGLREFSKWYYGQVRKEGLIVDIRGNGGGSVSQMLIERLRRRLLGTDFARNSDVTFTYPNVVFHGPMVALMSETSGSDGDIFPWMFKKAGLGPVIGKRSWGGVIGISNRGPLLDGGQVYVPEFGTAGEQGQWIIEGVGVEPDIEVDNDPLEVMDGKDAQLERGIAEVVNRLESNPTPLPTRPEPPVKTP